MFKNLDFYEVLQEDRKGGLDPSLGREKNRDKLQTAARSWNRLFGAEADLTKQLITEALNVFNSEKNYKKFRLWYAEFKLSPFIEGASVDGKLTKGKANEAKERAKRAAITEAEVEELFKRMNLEVVDRLPTEEKLIDLRPALAISKYVFAVLMVLILSYTGYNYWWSNSNSNGVQINSREEINEALYVVNKSAPLWLEFKKAVKILQQYKDNSSNKSRINKGLLQAKEYAINMGNGAPNDKEALDWFEVARNIDPNDREVNELIQNVKERLMTSQIN